MTLDRELELLRRIEALVGERDRLRAAGIRFADWIETTYGSLSKDRPPGPPTNLVSQMRETFKQ